MRESLPNIPVFYSEAMLAETDSFSPSAGKPRHVLSAWQRSGFPVLVSAVTPASVTELCLDHDPAYVLGILGGALPNGFGNTSPDVAGSLPYTMGAMIAAGRTALETGCACAPVSGFHHAQYDSAGGYCTFNGLMVAAEVLLQAGAIERVLILDCDMHYGNGTDAILDRLGRESTITNATFGRRFHQPRQASAYLKRLRETVARFDEFDLVLYQAGADVHIDDPLGGVLSTDQMHRKLSMSIYGTKTIIRGNALGMWLACSAVSTTAISDFGWLFWRSSLRFACSSVNAVPPSRERFDDPPLKGKVGRRHAIRRNVLAPIVLANECADGEGGEKSRTPHAYRGSRQYTVR